MRGKRNSDSSPGIVGSCREAGLWRRRVVSVGDFVSDAPRKGGLFVIHVADGCSLAIVDELASSEE